MKKFTKVCLIICAAFAVFGIGSIIAGFSLGTSMKDVRAAAMNGELPFVHTQGNWFSWGIYGWGYDEDDYDWEDSYDGQLTEGEFEYGLDEVENLNFDISRGNLNLEKSEDDKIHVKIFNSSDTVRNDGDTLKIRSKGTRRSSHTIMVSIPESAYFQEIKMDVSAGRASIEDVNTDKLEVSVGAGEFRSSGTVTAKEMDVEVGAGSFSMDLVKADEIDLECNAGTLSASIQGNEQDYRTELEVGAGNIDIGSTSCTGLSQKQTFNSNISGKKIEAACNAGTIKVDFTS